MNAPSPPACHVVTVWPCLASVWYCLCSLCSAASGPLGLDALGGDCSHGRSGIWPLNTPRAHSHIQVQGRKEGRKNFPAETSASIFLRSEQRFPSPAGMCFHLVFCGIYHWAMFSGCHLGSLPSRKLKHCHADPGVYHLLLGFISGLSPVS